LSNLVSALLTINFTERYCLIVYRYIDALQEEVTFLSRIVFFNIFKND